MPFDLWAVPEVFRRHAMLCMELRFNRQLLATLAEKPADDEAFRRALIMHKWQLLEKIQQLSLECRRN